jgi:hypothetical protein
MKKGFKNSSSNFLKPVIGFFYFSSSSASSSSRASNGYGSPFLFLSLFRHALIIVGIKAPRMIVVKQTIIMTEL